MLVLENSTSDKLQLITDAAGDLEVTIAYALLDTSSPPVVQAYKKTVLASITSATTTDLLAGSSSPAREIVIKSIFSRNNHASQLVNCTLQQTDGTNTNTLMKVPCYAGESFGVNEAGDPWHMDTNSGLYLSGVPQQYPSLLVCPMFATAALTGVKSITTATAFAVYLGKATRAASSVQLRYQVTTAMVTITWGEAAIAKGAINPGGNPTLTVVGFADISAVANSTGRKTTTVNVSNGQSINAGDDLWAIFGNAATTVAILRAPTMADDNQVGVQASLGSRPSTIVGTPTAWTIEGAATLPVWVAALI